MASRKDILEMLAKGEIDVDRATELLSQAREGEPQAPPPPPAAEHREPPAPPQAPHHPPAAPPPPRPQAAPPAPPAAAHRPQPPRPPAPPKNGRWLHIHVSDLETGRSRVKVNVPLGLVQFGMKIGARFTDEVDSEMMRSVMDAIQSREMSGTLVEVEDVEDNERVHIYID